MNRENLKYTLTEMNDKNCEKFYKANEEYVIPEELKKIIKDLADK